MSEGNYKETWFIAPRYILDLKGLTFNFFKVYETIFQFWNKRLPCFLTNPAISERTGVDLREVKRALEFFEKCNELKRTKKGKRRYLSQPLKEIETDSTPDDEGQLHPPCLKHEQENGSGGTIAPPHEGQLHPPEYKEENTDKNINNIKASSAPLSSSEYQETYFPMSQNTQKPMTKKKPQGLTAFVASSADYNICGLTMESIEQHLSVRSSKKVPLTSIAWKRIQNELFKCDDPQDAFDEMITRGWVGFNKDWLKGITNNKKTNLDHDDLSWINGEHLK